MPHFEINQRNFPTQKCAASTETLCGMHRFGVRLTPFYCAACAVLCNVNEAHYTWDDNGNLLSDGIHTYAYDHANRLVGASSAGVTASYAYNGMDDRLQEAVNGVTTRFTMDLNSGLTQVLADGTSTYLHGNGRIAQYSAGGTEYFLGDALGSVRQLGDATGAVTLAKAYQPYGSVLNSIENTTTNFGFMGEWTDSNIELVYLRSRWYSPQSGRFITRDTWQGDHNRSLSFNKWLHGYANPVVLVDPSGYLPLLKFVEQATYTVNVMDRKGEPTGEYITYDADSWTSAEMIAAESAAQRVGRAFADTINSKYSVLRYVYGKDCYRGYERHLHLPPISPTTAFLIVYRGPVTWEKRGESVINVETGQPCAEGTCAYAETQSRNLIYVWNNARVGYAVDHPGWVVHELGHAFEWASVTRNRYGTLYRPGQTEIVRDYQNLIVRASGDPNDQNNPDPYAGFAGGFNEWQFSDQLTAGEIFADMFVGWVYDAWQRSNNKLSPLAQDWANFMNSVMPYLLRVALNK